MNASALYAGSVYAAVILAGFLGIIAIAPDGQVGALVAAWVGVAGTSGLAGSLLARQRETAQDVKALRNGEMETKVQKVIGRELAMHAAREDSKRTARRAADDRPPA